MAQQRLCQSGLDSYQELYTRLDAGWNRDDNNSKERDQKLTVKWAEGVQIVGAVVHYQSVDVNSLLPH